MTPDDLLPQYNRLSAFYQAYATQVLKIDPSSDGHPSHVYGDLVQRNGLSAAMNSLQSAINEASLTLGGLTTEELRRLDSTLQASGVMTATEVIDMCASSYAALIDKGSIDNEVDFDFLVAMLADEDLEMDPIERQKVERMVESSMFMPSESDVLGDGEY